jgi:hypothetical protein
MLVQQFSGEMMGQVIIYKQDGGVVAVIHPAPQAIEEWGIEAIALKDVPAGKPFKIIEAVDLPEGREHRAAWTVDDEDLTDGVGADSNEFPDLNDDEGADDEHHQD